MITFFFVNKSWRFTYIRVQKLPEVKRRVSLEQAFGSMAGDVVKSTFYLVSTFVVC
jgi:hypothetical protein